MASWTSGIFFPSERLDESAPVPQDSLTIFREKLAPFFEEGNIDSNSTLPDEAFIDLVGCLIHESINLKQFLSFISSIDIANSEQSKESLTDAVWFWGTQIANEAGTANVKPSIKWTRLCALVKELFISKTVEIDRMKKTLELNLLAGSGIWSDEQTLQKRLVKINTSLVYRQDKYNLLREETEGYSKLLTVLADLPPPPEDPSLHVKHVFSVIGYFDLDPNRVLDITLEAMEQQIWNTSYLSLLKMFRRASVAHILGFKLSQYHKKSGADEAGSISTPASLYTLTAVLLTSKLITLEQILPYLSPSVAETTAGEEEKQQALKREIMDHGSYSLAAKKPVEDSGKDKGKDTALADESKSDVTNGTSSASAAVEAPFAEGNQLIGVLAAVLFLRNWSLAVEIEEKLRAYSELSDPYSFSASRDALIALVEWRLRHVYEGVGYLGMSLGRIRDQKLPMCISEASLPVLGEGGSLAEQEDSGMEVVSEGGEVAVASQCQQVLRIEDVITETMPMLLALGHHLSASPRVYTQICRILKSRLDSYGSPLTNVENNEELKCTVKLLQQVLLPSLSTLECNPALTTLCWSVLSLFPFQTRYSLYSNWKGDGLAKGGISGKPLPIVFSETRNLHSAKGYFKRLTKENTKQIGRQLAKHTHSSALVVFDYILSQIEAYDNMIPFVVEALRYTTELSRDVMSYALLNQLRKDSNKLKPGDTHYSSWYSALSKFIGAFYKKYPSTELHGLLHYLLDRMSTGESLDLLVLKEVLGRMGGCDTMLEVSHQQLEGLAGGRALRNEVMGAQVKDAVNKKAQKILRDTMLSSGTAIPLLLFIAQCRSNIIYNGGSTQLKLISYLYDTCQDVLMQFTDFLVGGNSKGAEGMVEIFPPMRHLLGEVGLNVSVAFQLVRPLIRAALHYGEDPASAPPELQNWHPYSNEMKDVVCQYLPAEVWSALSPELYLTFWSLSLYDVFVPKSKYDTEIRRLKDRYSELDIKPPAGEDRLTHKQRRTEMTKILNLTNTLKEEQEAQKKHVDIVTNMIKKHKDSYLSHVSPECAPKSTENIMQHCVYHRVLMSPADAIFCSQFFLNLHAQETPGFSTIHFFDKTMKTLAPITFCSTEYEAGFLGFYINDLLETCNRWVSNKAAYTKEARAKCGMEKTFGSKSIDARATHEEFLNVYKIWHKRLAGIVATCLKSPEYMHARSALVFLSKVSGQFPTRAMAGKAILAGVDSIEKDGSKEDLKIMARSLGAIIRKRSTTWVDDEPKDKKRPPVPPVKTAKKTNETEDTAGKANTATAASANDSSKVNQSTDPVDAKGKPSASVKGGDAAGRKLSDGKSQGPRDRQRDRSRSNSKSNDAESTAKTAPVSVPGATNGGSSRSSTDIARDAVKASMRAKRGRDIVAPEGSAVAPAPVGGGNVDTDSAKASVKIEAIAVSDNVKAPETSTATERAPKRARSSSHSDATGDSGKRGSSAEPAGTAPASTSGSGDSTGGKSKGPGQPPLPPRQQSSGPQGGARDGGRDDGGNVGRGGGDDRRGDHRFPGGRGGGGGGGRGGGGPPNPPPRSNQGGGGRGGEGDGGRGGGARDDHGPNRGGGGHNKRVRKN